MAMHLLHGDDSIACIGQACGFSDQSAFTRKFKAETGFSPRAYRARIGGGIGEPALAWSRLLRCAYPGRHGTG